MTIKNHGGRLRSKSEIRVATVFKNTPEPFKDDLRARTRPSQEKEHNKAFYALCEKMSQATIN